MSQGVAGPSLWQSQKQCHKKSWKSAKMGGKFQECKPNLEVFCLLRSSSQLGDLPWFWVLQDVDVKSSGHQSVGCQISNRIEHIIENYNMFHQHVFFGKRKNWCFFFVCPNKNPSDQFGDCQVTQEERLVSIQNNACSMIIFTHNSRCSWMFVAQFPLA